MQRDPKRFPTLTVQKKIIKQSHIFKVLRSKYWFSWYPVFWDHWIDLQWSPMELLELKMIFTSPPRILRNSGEFCFSYWNSKGTMIWYGWCEDNLYWGDVYSKNEAVPVSIAKKFVWYLYDARRPPWQLWLSTLHYNLKIQKFKIETIFFENPVINCLTLLHGNHAHHKYTRG